MCLLRDDSPNKAGGTNELLERAKAIGVPALEIRIAVQNGHPVCHHTWHSNPARPFRPPAVPEPLDQFSLLAGEEKIPSDTQWSERLKEFASGWAKKHQQLFRYAAALIITLHILATLCATVALALHGASHVPPPTHGEPLGEQAIPWLLGIELILLLAGFSMHHYLYHRKAPRNWATARVVAELTRSSRELQPRHLYLEHLFRLSLPHHFRHLLRTLNVWHLRSTSEHRNNPGNSWESHRDNYLKRRINHQIGFYQKAWANDERRLKRYQGLFTVATVLALLATLAKLILVTLAAARGGDIGLWPQLLGTLCRRSRCRSRPIWSRAEASCCKPSTATSTTIATP
ncbi:hypothetical protein [Nitrosococcus watsonii]|uniref:hypothetical protein n=1 Tax=Nitrosococcus watsonii TaxID=473531 RepID=UPI000313977D|nr:hypothetical protein [Nitrosococcus watsonii]